MERAYLGMAILAFLMIILKQSGASPTPYKLRNLLYGA